jgi:hypothetical protein
MREYAADRDRHLQDELVKLKQEVEGQGERTERKLSFWSNQNISPKAARQSESIGWQNSVEYFSLEQ